MNIELEIAQLKGKGINLWTEDGKLKYRAKDGAMNGEVLEWLKNNKQEIIDFFKNNNIVEHDEDNRYEPFPLTSMQNAYLIGRNKEYELGGTGCHSYTEFKVADIDCQKLEKAWHKLIMRHDMLRAVFSEEGFQKVIESPEMPALLVNDFSELTEEDASNKFMDVRKRMESYDYVIGQWPMHSFEVSKLKGHYIIHFSIDMLIADFVSVNVIVSQLFKLYEGEELPDVADKLSFRDIVIADGKEMAKSKQTGKYGAARDYWNDKIQTMAGAPVLPVKDNITNKVNFTRHTYKMAVPKWNVIKEIAKNKGVTSSVAIMTAYIETISRWSSSKNFCINLTLMDRDRSYLDSNDVVGDFTTVSVFSVNESSDSFIDRTKDNQEELIKDLDNKSFSGIEVLQELSRFKGEKVMIPVVYTSTLGSKEDQSISEKSELTYGVSRTPQVLIDCQTIESNGCLVVNWDVRDGVFDSCVIDEMFNALKDGIERLSEGEESWNDKELIRLSDATLLKREKLNKTGLEIKDRFLHEGFLNNVEKNPDNIALISEGVKYSYGELAKYVQTFSDSLKNAGIVQGDKVAIIVNKGIMQIAAVLGTLFQGGVYVPIAVDQPNLRQKAIIEDAGAKIVITEKNIECDNVAFIDINEVSPAGKIDLSLKDIKYEDSAYIIFTSGSTGRPKGVVISHKAAMNTITDIDQRFGITSEDVILGVSSLTFDLSVYDIFGAFTEGATLVLPDKTKEKSPAHWSELIDEYGVTVWNSVPALLSMLVDYKSMENHPKNNSMKCIMLSGDLIPRTFPGEIRKLFNSAKIYSLGGATEAAIWSIYYPITDYDLDKNIPYGMPLSNQEFYILDDMDKICPDNVIGEICIAGTGLADGYYGDEEMTNKKFYMHRDLCKRIYRTGDLGYYNEDGIIEFVGRRDFQVKLNGHRIELGEVENALMKHSLVDQAVATIFEDANGRKSLEAFVVPKKSQESSVDYRMNAKSFEKEVNCAADEVLKDRSKKDILDWKKCSENTAVTDMLWVFRSAGVFNTTDETYTYRQIMDAVNPNAEFEHIVKRWLNVLEKEELVKESLSKYSLTQKGTRFVDRDAAWNEFRRLEDKVKYSHELFEYQKKSSDLLLKQVRGEVRGLDLFFPEGKTDVAEAAYQDNIVNNALNQGVKTAILGIINEKQTRLKRTINILEIGAGVGGTTNTILSAIKDMNITYTFTDVSNFFLSKAKDRYKDYGFMKYALYDINRDYKEQDIHEGYYDIILCANVLHNAKNCHDALEIIKKLAVANGALIIIDTTADSYSLLTSLELKGGLNDFTDVRKDREQTFFTEKDWITMFDGAGIDTVITYPGKTDILSEIGQKMFVNIVNMAEAEIDTDGIREFLKGYLLPYMIPGKVSVLKEMPLSSNGKVDRKKLKPAFDTLSCENTDETTSFNEIQKKLADIWKDVLNIDSVGLYDNFYSVGGDSLLIAQIVTKMRENIPEFEEVAWDDLMRDILKDPTIAGISAITQKDNSSKTEANSGTSENRDVYHDNKCMHIYQKGDGNVVTAFFHAGTGRIKDYAQIAPELCERCKDRTVVGFTYGDEELYLDVPPEKLIYVRAQAYANRLEELKAKSYRLVGYCVGGFVAMETAKVLIERGYNVEPVLTISSHLCLHSVENQLLFESAYGVILGADIYKAGYRGDPASIRGALEEILKGENRNVTDKELCALTGKYKELGEAFSELTKQTHKQRMESIYDSIENPDFCGDQSTVIMLNILYDIFEHTYKAMIRYKPDFFTGDIVALIPDEDLTTIYPNMIPDTDWDEFVLGNCEKHIVHGDHNTCIDCDHYEQIMDYLI